METDASDLVAARRRKAEELRERGVDPYPNDFSPSHTVAAVRQRYEHASREELESGADPLLSVAGRIVGLRDFGRASFLHLQDRTGKLQVYVKRDVVGEGAFETFKACDLGDFLGVEGRPFRTKTDELTIEARAVRLLAKALRPLPEKWHGLTDVETRYRQRYLDLVSNADVRATFEARARIIHRVRSFLLSRDYLEVETPMMQIVPGGAAAKPFVTRHNALGIDLYLRIAPELYLKRLLVGGFERVFELNRVFRNEGISTQHNPEFTMLEFYQAYATYEDLMSLTEELVVEVADDVAGARQLPYGSWTIDLEPPWRRISLPEYVVERTGLSRDAVFEMDVAALEKAAEKAGAGLRPNYPAHYGPAAGGHLLTDLFEALAEPELVQPTFVHDYPAAVSPLARRNPTRPQFVDRFELYVCGREIANAFSELNDPDDQRRRFEEQLRAKAAGDEEAHEMDEDYVRALEHGMPPAAGEGIGIDRLVMLFTNAASIRDVILFPHLRPEAR